MKYKFKLRQTGLLFFVIIFLLSVTACGPAGNSPDGESEEQTGFYQKIGAEQALVMIEKENVTLLDVRTQEEFDEGHIETAILFPNDEIMEKAESALPNKDAAILVYCRSGNRSAQASKALVELGYTNVYDLGGLKDWPYEIVR